VLNKGPLKGDVLAIASHYLASVRDTLRKAGRTREVDDDALTAVIAKGHSAALGARFLKRVIDDHIKVPISRRWHDGSHFHVRLRGADLIVETRASNQARLTCVA
jgi:ATP-dependent Clp protease ATP-binding subunit ClpA